MAVRVLRVLLYGASVGELVQDDMRIRFSYDSDLMDRIPNPTPLSLSMPPYIDDHTGDAVAAFLWGLLPENPAVLARWAREFQVSVANPVGLLEHVGLDCAGAVQFVRPDDLDEAVNPGGVEWLTESGVARLLRTLRRDATAWHGGAEEGQFSLAGAQSKTALVYEGSRWGRPWGRTATTHILKPAIPGLDDQDINEHLCLSTARGLGLTAARTAIRTFEDQTALVVERYDRAWAGNHRIRVHQEDLCQAMGVHPVNKYQADGGPGPRDIVDLFHAVQSTNQAHESTLAFVDAVILNWWLAGTDGHAKNFSVLLSDDQVRLAPLYDISSALPYPELMNPHKLKLAMKVGKEYRVKYIARREWTRLAQDLDLDAEELLSRVRQLGEAIPDAMAEAAADPAVRSLDSALPGTLTDAIAKRVNSVLRELQVTR
jgi:serine/threonine-protein kinase HipA